MRPRLFLIAIAILLLVSGGAAAALFSGGESASLSDPSASHSRASQAKDDEGIKEGAPETARNPRRDRDSAQKIVEQDQAPKPTPDRAKPKGDDKTKGGKNVDSDKARAIAERIEREAAEKKAAANASGAGKLPDQIIADLKEGERLDPRRALQVRAGSGRVRQSRQGSEPAKRNLTPPAAGSVPEEGSTALRPGLYAEIYNLSEPASAIFARNEEPTKGAPTTKRIDNYIDFPDRESFQLTFDSDDFIVRWTGYLYLAEDTALYFGLGNDLGGALSIDGQAVVVNDVFSWYVETWAAVGLTKGYHQITVEHIEGNSHGDQNRNTACRLLYKTQWGASIAPKVVPAAWFFQPEQVGAAAPEITRVTPQGATLEDDIIIEGRNFATQVSMGPVGAIFDSSAGIEVLIDGIPAELKSVAMSKITAKVPAGAGSGLVEVRRYGVPSNRVQLDLDARFGLVVSIWDMSNRSGTTVPQNEPADFIVLDDEPFPMTRSKYAQFAGKPIAIRLEGQMAVHEVETEHKFTYSYPTGASEKEKEAARANATKEVIHGSGYQYITDGLAQKALATVTAFGATVSHEFNGDENRPGPSGGGGGNSGNKTTTSFWIDKLLPAHQWEGFTLQTGGVSGGWLALKVDLFFPLSDGNSGWIEPSFDFEPTTVHNAKRASHFRPNFIPPEAPVVFISNEHYLDINGDPLEIASAPVEGELLVLVDMQSLNFTGPVDQRLSFFVDDVATTYKLGFVREDGSIDVAERYRQINGADRAFKVVRVKIPDLAGEGKLRARMGIVQSDILTFDVANRGLVGFYYDFDQVLTSIPDVSSMLPIVRRIDKTLEFENNAIFNLPFPAERFSAEWYGQIRVPAGGEWTFIIQSDDGFRLKIGDKIVSEFPGLRPPRESRGKIKLSAGWHDLHIEFYENDVIENYVMWWIPPGKSERERIPTMHYRPQRDAGIPDKFPAIEVKVTE